MQIHLSNIRGNKGEWLARAFWLALALVHIAPLVALLRQVHSGASAELAWKIAGIGLSLAFFGLKTLDVEFLRIRCRWTGLAVFLTVCSLVHQDVRQEFSPSTVVPLVAVTTMAAAVPAMVNRRRLMPRLVLDLGSTVKAHLLPAFWRRVVDKAVYPLVLNPGVVVSVPRGPPEF